MSNFTNNMQPTATAGAFMQPNTEVSPATWGNYPPTYTSPAYTAPANWGNKAPTFTSPAFTSPANISPTYVSPAAYSPMGYGHVHSHMHYGHMKSSAYGEASSVGIILVLFILLVIISRACFI
jgi:hypothetical protein